MSFDAETIWEFSLVPRVKFGTGSTSELHDDLERYDAETILVVTDQGVVDAGLVDRLEDGLGDDPEITIFSDVLPDPSLAVFDAARETAEEVSPELIVGLGGGSSLDVAKVTGALYHAGDDLLEYVAPPTGSGAAVPQATVPTICLPTTAGTGSETSPVAVLSLPDERKKVGISSRSLIPDVAVIDPELTVSLPPGPTAFSGIDALAHAVEAYVTRPFDANPRPNDPADRPDYGGRTLITDAFARRAIALVADALQTAVNDGTNLGARVDMCLASFMAGAAFTNAGLGAAHAMAMAVGARHDASHGQSIAAVLPAVIRYNATSAADRYTEIARCFGEHVAHDSRDEAARRAADGVSKLISDLGVSSSLSELGITEADIDPLVEKTLTLERLLAGNPKRVDEEAMRVLYRSAL